MTGTNSPQIPFRALNTGSLRLEQYRPYSGFEASSHDDIRLRGPTAFGMVGPTDAYGPNSDGPYVVYAVPDLGAEYAFAGIQPGIIHLAPGGQRGQGHLL